MKANLKRAKYTLYILFVNDDLADVEWQSRVSADSEKDRETTDVVSLSSKRKIIFNLVSYKPCL